MKKLTNFISRNTRKMASSSSGGGSETSSGNADKLHGILNDLRFQKSPYLLQHKHNPVEWHPWTPSTHQLAVTRQVPIFLSIGYSTCHWCHVMERESFENPAIAAIMNEKFVNIKIDREERPDVDRVYMSFVQAVSGSGGWPLSVWMTPDLKPFYGGTYYPPDNRYFGRPGFKSLLLSISEQWEENQQKCMESSENIYKLLKKSANIAYSDHLPSGSAIVEKCVSQLKRSYEPSFGGFSEAPKFPQPGNFVFLIDYCVKNGGIENDKVKSVWKMIERGLVMMGKGGIYDHVGKGFARYSTDKKWHVPHFEKMLYDQSQLVEVYALAFKMSGNDVFSRITDEIVEYVVRDLRNPEGGFYSAEDADSVDAITGEKREGAFYVFTGGEIDEIVVGKTSGLENSDVFRFAYGVKPAGNVGAYQDPHDELKEKNVLFIANDVAACADKFSMTVEQVEAILRDGREKLFEWRNSHRQRPGLDDKVVCSWNGLMIRGLSVAYLALGKKEYLDLAVEALRFCQKYLVTEGGDLLRTCYAEGSVGIGNLDEPIHACVDDFCNLVSGCLGVFMGGGGVEFLELAVKLQDKQDELFWDGERGGYFNSRGDDNSVIIRMKDDDDGAEPSSNSTSFRNLLELSQIQSVVEITTTQDYSTKIPSLVKQFTDRLEKIPVALPIMSSLVDSYVNDTYVTLVYADEITTIGKTAKLPYGSVIVPVCNGCKSKVKVEKGKVVKLTGKSRSSCTIELSDLN